MKSRKARSRFVAAAIASCLLVGACGANTDPATGDAPDGPLVSEADHNAHLRLGYQSPPPALNPHQLTSPALSYVYVSPVYDRLTQIVMADGTHELAPMVATEWTFAPDGMSATFTLREGVTFSDGAVLDSVAVKANLDHAKNTPGSTAAPAFSMIDSVEALDPTHVKIHTNRPAADLPYALSASEGSLISPNALDNPDLDRNPVGSGPYIATDVRLGDSVTYERREGYWDESAQMAKTITITGLPDDNARMNALRSGQIDIGMMTLNQYPEAERLGEGYRTHLYTAAPSYAVYLNVDRPNLSDPRVRQALNYAIDREGINQSLTGGQCQPNNQPLAPGKDGYLENPPVAYNYDPDKARALLAEAGANDLTIDLFVGASISPQRQMAAAIQSQLQAVGVTVNLNAVDFTDGAARYAAGAVDGWVNVRASNASPLQTLSRNYTNRQQFPGTPPPEFTAALLPAFDPNATDTDRTEALESASAIVNEQALDLFVCALPSSFILNDRVIGIENMGTASFSPIPDLRRRSDGVTIPLTESNRVQGVNCVTEEL